LTPTLVGGEWSTSRPGRFTPGERTPDDLEKIKFFTLPESNSDPLVVQPVASRYTDYAIPAPVGSLRNNYIAVVNLTGCPVIDFSSS
jgi:hypothetical protein